MKRQDKTRQGAGQGKTRHMTSKARQGQVRKSQETMTTRHDKTGQSQDPTRQSREDIPYYRYYSRSTSRVEDLLSDSKIYFLIRRSISDSKTILLIHFRFFLIHFRFFLIHFSISDSKIYFLIRRSTF